MVRRFIGTILVLFFAASPALAQYDGQYVLSRGFGKVLDAVALNGAAATRTFQLTLDQRYARVLLTFNYTYSTATAITVTPSCTDSTLTTEGAVQSGTITSGVKTLVAYSTTKAVSATGNWQDTFGVAGQQTCTFVVAGTGAGAGDLLTVTATAVVQ